MSSVLECAGVNVRFGHVEALAQASLRVERGEIVALLGPSGCGKTTLLRAIAGFQRVDAGEIQVEERLVESPKKHVAPHQRPAGMVFQDFALFPHLTVAANIGYGLSRGEERERRVRELLALAGLETMGERYPHQLSAGQQQRVAILRSLAPRPAVLLLDEPFSNLDPSTHATLREQVAVLLRAQDVTAILVTHDRSDAFAVADRVAVMHAGRILQFAPPAELYYRPASLAVAASVGNVQVVAGVAKDGRVETSLGSHVIAGTPLQGACDALIRPEWIAPGEGGVVAEIQWTRLEGESTRTGLLLPGGTTVEMLTPSGSPFAGRSMAVTVRLPVPVFAKEI